MNVEILLRYIAQSQQSNGSFSSLSSPSENFSASTRTYHTTFFASWIALLLQSNRHELAQEICTSACSYLLSQKSATWTWNYWHKESPEYSRFPVPDDADDTFCALTAIQTHKPSVITSQVLETIAYQLMHIESKTGGPYYTWYTQNPEWRQHIDVAVNANIAYFLHQQGIFLEKLDGYVDQHINGNELQSPYYPSPLMTLYFLSRTYHDHHPSKLEECIRAIKPDNLLEACITVTALCNLKTPTSITYAHNLFHNLDARKEAIVKPYAWCIDPAIKGRKHYAGASALTCAAYSEALIALQQVT